MVSKRRDWVDREWYFEEDADYWHVLDVEGYLDVIAFEAVMDIS